MSKNINWSAFKLSILIKMVGQIRTLLIIVKIDGKLLCTTKLQNIRRNSVCHKVQMFNHFKSLEPKFTCFRKLEW